VRVLVGLVAVVALGGCNVLLSTDDYATAPETPCQRCVASACSELERVCLADDVGDDNCALVDRCIAKCALNDVHCRGQCLVDHPVGRQAFSALDDCRHAHCAPACIGTHGFGSVIGEQCDKCLSEQCSQESNDCAGERQCDWAFACLDAKNPVSPATLGDCAYDFAGDLTESMFTLWNRCMQKCPDCATGTHWDCTGQFSYSGSYLGGDLSYRARVDSVLDQTSTDGVAVNACNPLACRGPFYVQNGAVDVDLPLLETGVFPVDGHFRFSADGFVPSIQYLGRPITRYEHHEGFELLSKSDETKIAAGLGSPIDPNRGLVVFRPEDCMRHDAHDVELDGVTGWTELSGIAPFRGFVDVPPGSYTIRMRRAGGDQVLGSLSVRVEAGTLTGAAILPDAEK
jgi:hypothetical protein